MKAVTKAPPTGKHGKTEKIAKGPTGIERQRPVAMAPKTVLPRSKVAEGLRAAIKNSAKVEPVKRAKPANAKSKPGAVSAPASYEGRDPDKRRAYMAELMRKRRAANKAKTRKGKRK